MSKEQLKESHKGEGVKLVGSPEKIIDLLILSDIERERVTDQLINHGSKHKQVLTALLLKRLLKLVQTIEKGSGLEFEMQEGYELTIEKNDKEKVLPVIIPVNLGSGEEEENVVDAISHAPEHEALVYAIYMQVVEWAIKASAEQATS